MFSDSRRTLRLVVPNNPNSAGGFLVIWSKYDHMGRLSEQSNPTETTDGGAPTGDDAAGYQWTRQAYDWQGRPTITTAPTGNTTEVSYDGCGCAGGEVTTTRDERGRRRKLYKDTLGRLVKVEELNWDTSVYAATNYSYNARDQLTQSNQSGQLRTFEYDGHARLWRKTTPEQGQTTYAYNADDTVQSVTDARGATTTVTYNARHLPTQLTYGVPAGVAATSNVSFAYDQAGNRTSMTDGLGSVSYNYDQLSRLTAETRNFTGVGSFTLSYSYNLAGQLTSVTNPWSAQVSYSHDAVGRTTTVNGANYAGVSTYASNLRYRAFGGLKAATYGNGKTLSLGYDTRLRLTQYTVAGVMGWQYAFDKFSENSGRVTYAQNTLDPTLDRSYDYDHLGRLQYAHTGNEARGHVGLAPWPEGMTPDGPYSQHTFYDQFGNLTQRAGWGGANASYTVAFTNNRRTDAVYDASGNITVDGGQSYSYDVTGQQTAASYNNLQMAYDGDRLRVKKTEDGTTTYYLRSSVLGGPVVAEMNSGGGWMRGYVYVGSQLLALQQAGVFWTHQDPVTKSQRLTDSGGNITTTIDLDPWGGETTRSVNSSAQPQRYTSYTRDANQSDEAMHRRYNRWWSRFDQPDPYDGSANLVDPQSLNRYAYVQNDPVNYVDPTGLYEACVHEAMTKFLATLTGRSNEVAAALGRFAGDKPGGADSKKYAATSFWNAIKGIFGKGPSADIHFASERTLAREIGRFGGYMALGTDRGYQKAAFVLHSIQDVHGAHQGYSLPLGHALAGSKPDRSIGDAKFMRAANETYQVLAGNKSASLSGQQVHDLINAIITGCGKDADKLVITHEVPTFGVGGGIGGGGGGSYGGGGYPSWYYSMWSFANWVRSIPVGRREEVTVQILDVSVDVIMD